MCGGKKKEKKRMIRQMLNWNTDVVLAYNEWLYVFGFATHILQFKAQKPIGKTDIYNVLYAGR